MSYRPASPRLALVTCTLALLATTTSAPGSAAGRGKGGGGGDGGPRVISFAGYDWVVKDSGKRRLGPGPNFFSSSADNVWVDGGGRLHLRITRAGSRWLAAEVISTESFGYGTYRFFLDSPVDDLDPQVVLGLFTWNDDPAYAHREIDIEMARWGNAAAPDNAQYVVQPYDAEGHLVRFVQPPLLDQSTHSFTWLPDSVAFRSLYGHLAEPGDPSDVIAAWTFGGDVPVPGGENARLNLWLFQGKAPSDGQEVEVVVSDFTFTPAP